MAENNAKITLENKQKDKTEILGFIYPYINVSIISEEDGMPVFSVPLRSDQNNLFIKSVKSRANTTKQ